MSYLKYVKWFPAGLKNADSKCFVKTLLSKDFSTYTVHVRALRPNQKSFKYRISEHKRTVRIFDSNSKST